MRTFNYNERLVGVAILRGGFVKSYGLPTYDLVRLLMNDASPMVEQPGDVIGFLTNTDRFVLPKEARKIAVNSGQFKPKGNATPFTLDRIKWEA